MSLLSCVCSLAHKHSTAVCWDDLEHPYVWTYAELLTRAREITCNLRGSGLIQQAVVGLYGESCPEMLAAMLGILALPAAYLPVDLSQTDFMEVLREHGVDMLLVHLPLFQVCSYLYVVHRYNSFRTCISSLEGATELTILLILKWPFRWHPFFLLRSNFSESGQNPWTIVRCFYQNQNLAYFLWSFYSNLDSAGAIRPIILLLRCPFR